MAIESQSRTDEDRNYGYPTHHELARQLADAAQSGCKFCLIIVKRTWWETGGQMSPSSDSGATSTNPFGTTSASGRFTWYTFHKRDDNPSNYQFMVFLRQPVQTPRGKLSCALDIMLEDMKG